MADLVIEGDELVLRLSREEKLEGVHRDLRAPLSSVTGVEVLEDAHRAADTIGIKVGTRIPGVIEVASVIDLASEGLDLEPAWQVAVSSIVEEHNRRADPRFAQERIGREQRFAIELLRDPSVTLPPGAGEAEEALVVERSSTVRAALSRVRNGLADGRVSRDEAARQVVEVVESFGLQPVEAAPPLEAITEDDVGVVCRMGILPA